MLSLWIFYVDTIYIYIYTHINVYLPVFKYNYRKKDVVWHLRLLDSLLFPASPTAINILHMCVCPAFKFEISVYLNVNISEKTRHPSTNTTVLCPCNRHCRYRFSPSPGTSACQTPRGAQKWCACTSTTTASVRWRRRQAENRKARGGEFPVTIASSSMPQVQMSALPFSFRLLCLFKISVICVFSCQQLFSYR